MEKSKLYTRTGDKGQTGLVNGARVSKDHPRIELYGGIDELNSYLGLIAVLIKGNQDFEIDYNQLIKIQSALFELGALCACDKLDHEKFRLNPLDQNIIFEIEERIDAIDSFLVPLKNFILPGGGVISSHFHIARTICRRAEREIVAFEKEFPGEISPESFYFLNRLSDYLFILSRFSVKIMNEEEVIWRPSHKKKK